MATHFSVLAWKIPWMEEPGRDEVLMEQAKILFPPLSFCQCIIECVCTNTQQRLLDVSVPKGFMYVKVI